MVMAVMLFATLVAIYCVLDSPDPAIAPGVPRALHKEESFFAALREKLKGIKQKLSSAIVIIASAAVTGYDFLAPIVSGVDVSSLTSRVPSWAWPLILISLTALFQFLRNLADKRHRRTSASTALGHEGVAPCGLGLRA